MASLWHHLLALSYTSHILFRCFASFVMFSMPLIWTLMINVWPMQYATVKIFWIAATGSSIHKWPSARTGQPPSLAVSGHCRISRVTWRHLFTCTYTAQWSHQLTRPPQHWYRNCDNINKCLHLNLWHLPAKPQNLIIHHTLSHCVTSLLCHIPRCVYPQAVCHEQSSSTTPLWTNCLSIDNSFANDISSQLHLICMKFSGKMSRACSVV